MLGGLMIPAMLILLGTSLATLKVSDLAASFAIAIGRLLIGISAGIAVIYLLGLTGMAAGIVFLMAAMPSAIVTYVFAERFQQSPTRVAGAVLVSTLLTFFCLPGLVWAAIWMAGSGASVALARWSLLP
jgi:predicted permease